MVIPFKCILVNDGQLDVGDILSLPDLSTDINGSLAMNIRHDLEAEFNDD